MANEINEELYEQHKKQAEKSVKKLLVGLAVLFFTIVIGAFFV